jgi:predicted lipid-binding transport protein (Tim44 family)
MKMVRRRWVLGTLMLSIILIFGVSLALESQAWARAGGGSSSGSCGGRSFSSPSMPSITNPSPTPGVTPNPGLGYGRSPFWSGLAGGIAGGFIGNLLFGGRAFGGQMGYGGGPGLLDLLMIGGLIYFLYRFFVRRRGEQSVYYQESESYPRYGTPFSGGGRQASGPQMNGVEMGLEEIGRSDHLFNAENFLETVEDLFFRIQAAWINRSLDGVQNLITLEMMDYFSGEFGRMKQQHMINRLENIAVRKVEIAEVWRESGRDFITVLFTANLLDYTVDNNTGEVIEGDKLNPVKFLEFWTFSRGAGSPQWQLAGINQLDQP